MLTLKQVTWTAPGGSSVLKGIDLVVPDHKLVVITGPNGGGKTTLAKLISGLENRIPAAFIWTIKTSLIWTSLSVPSWASVMPFSSPSVSRA